MHIYITKYWFLVQSFEEGGGVRWGTKEISGSKSYMGFLKFDIQSWQGNLDVDEKAIWQQQV